MELFTGRYVPMFYKVLRAFEDAALKEHTQTLAHVLSVSSPCIKCFPVYHCMHCATWPSTRNGQYIEAENIIGYLSIITGKRGTMQYREASAGAGCVPDRTRQRRGRRLLLGRGVQPGRGCRHATPPPHTTHAATLPVRPNSRGGRL